MAATALERELKRGSAEVLLLALVDEQDRHGYDIGRLIDQRSDGAITFHVASLYPTLYRLEANGLIDGRWVERPGQRRRRYYRLTAAGRRVLASSAACGSTSSSRSIASPGSAPSVGPTTWTGQRASATARHAGRDLEPDVVEELASHAQHAYDAAYARGSTPATPTRRSAISSPSGSPAPTA